MDLFGTSRTIQIDGVITGTVVSTLTDFITAIEAIQNGQQTGSTYVGSLVTTSKTVLIQTFSWSYLEAAPLQLKYSLTLMQGTAI